MNRRRISSHWALGLFAMALLLKAAVPWLATAAAHAQGKALFEICTVYGVATVPLDGSLPEPPRDHPGASHADQHCALSALLALAAPEPQASPSRLEARAAAGTPIAHRSPDAPDACATWVARLQHGPPVFS